MLWLISSPWACAQEPAQQQPAQKVVKSPANADEGELIELEEIQIHGEIAQPNVAITVSRAEPQFREIALERTPAEGMNDLDLSGLRTSIPPAARITDWNEMLQRPRQ